MYLQCSEMGGELNGEWKTFLRAYILVEKNKYHLCIFAKDKILADIYFISYFSN